MDRNELKVRALLERVRDLTTQYENERADLRVEITLQAQEIAELQQQLANVQGDGEPDVVSEEADASD